MSWTKYTVVIDMSQGKPQVCGRIQTVQELIRQNIWFKRGEIGHITCQKVTYSSEIYLEALRQQYGINKLLSPKTLHDKEVVAEGNRDTEAGSDVTYWSEQKITITMRHAPTNLIVIGIL